MKKPSTGRAKIEIKNLEDDAKKQVTFSKRRVGLMKKASELCVLCGAEIAILVTSPKRKRVFAFGHPTASAVIDRFLSGGSGGAGTPPPREYDHHLAGEYNRQLAEAERKLAEEKRVATEIGDAGGAEEGGLFLWERSVEEMGVEELRQYTSALEEMRSKVLNKCVEPAATTSLADCVATSSPV